MWNFLGFAKNTKKADLSSGYERKSNVSGYSPAVPKKCPETLRSKLISFFICMVIFISPVALVFVLARYELLMIIPVTIMAIVAVCIFPPFIIFIVYWLSTKMVFSLLKYLGLMSVFESSSFLFFVLSFSILLIDGHLFFRLCSVMEERRIREAVKNMERYEGPL